jgi:uncharacterized Zn finger protein
MGFDGFRPYVPIGLRRLRARREMERLRKQGHDIAPVVVEGRAIAKTFWGQSWCWNLERYSDYANRLPRGRTYVRNGSVVDLQVAAGEVTARVAGSELYTVRVSVSILPKKRWAALCDDCAGGIDSLVELLQGRLSQGVMARICAEKTGLFPSPAEIRFGCSCPDWASMCKHVAAVLYGIGARLDQRPELLFVLRRVDHAELIGRAGKDLPFSRKAPARGRVLASHGLSALFGIELADYEPPARRAKRAAAASRKRDEVERPEVVLRRKGSRRGLSHTRGRARNPPRGAR